MRSFPDLYADLVVRLVPGGAAVGLLALLGVRFPDAWVEFVWTTGPASALVSPLVLVGLSWLAGTVLEALTTDLVEWRFVRIFARVNGAYLWVKARGRTPARDAEPGAHDASSPRSIDAYRELTRRAVDRIATGPGRGAPNALARVSRAHSEARMFTSFAVLFVLATLLAIVGALESVLPGITCPTHPWGRISRIVALAFLAWVSWTGASERLKTRAIRIHRAVEQLRARGRRDPLRRIRNELRALGR